MMKISEAVNQIDGRILELITGIRNESKVWRKDLMQKNLRMAFDLYLVLTGKKHEEDKAIQARKIYE